MVYVLCNPCYAENKPSTIRTLVLPADGIPAALWTEMAHEFKKIADRNQPDLTFRIFTDDLRFGKAVTPAIIWGRKNKYNPFEEENRITLNEEEFYLNWTKDMKYLYIYGGSDRAEFYALEELIRICHLNWKDLFTVQKKVTPAFSCRLISGVSGEIGEALYRGYNTVSVNHNASEISEFKELLTPMFDKSGLKKIRKNQDKLSKELRIARYYYLDTFSINEEFEFPEEVLKHPLAARLVELDFDWKPYDKSKIFCIGRPEFWRFYGIKYNDFLTMFPNIDNAMISLKTYNDEIPFCKNCASYSPAERIAMVINKSYESIVTKEKRNYIQRTWDPNYKSWNSDPEMYKKVISLLDNTEDLILSTKYTISDFKRLEAHNPTLSIEGPRRIVEFQCKREYEGGGAFPSWMGEEYATAYRRALSYKLAGVWNQYGNSTNIWNQANAYALERLMWNPMENPITLAQEWAELYFGKETSPYMARIIKLSGSASEKMLYFSILGEQKTTETPLWIKNNSIRGGEFLEPILINNIDFIEEIIAEKNEAIEIINKMCSEAFLAEPKLRKIKPDNTLYSEKFNEAKLADFVVNSLEYERQLAVRSEKRPGATRRCY